jgi:predicted nuclease of restriction endonuclease-like (RecB) superfamily
MNDKLTLSTTINNQKIYANLLNDIKKRVRTSQIKAMLSANAEMLSTYWDIGKMIKNIQQKEGWGSKVIPKLAIDLHNELPEQKGFSERNLKFMIQFFNEYPTFDIIRKLPVSQLETAHAILQLPERLAFSNSQTVELFFQISWSHHIILFQKIKNMDMRLWYMQQTIQQGWSRDILIAMIKNKIHSKQGNATTNFNQTLPPLYSQLANQNLKDPYIFDFLTLNTHYTERELETELVKHIEKFLLELGSGFAFVGRQYLLTISNKDFYLDLLFYHLRLRCYIVIELKKGEFIPEYTGKLNFYCSAVDDLLRHPNDNPTIGLLLCQSKDKVFAEYALKDINKPIGISEYELTRILPNNLKSSLPTIEDIENELENQ